MDAREARGKEIASIDGSVKRIDATTYLVSSQSGQGAYDVLKGTLGWLCSCPDFIYRGLTCKHIFAVEYSFALRTEVSISRIEPILTTSKCVACGSSEIVRDGVRHNAYGDVQRFLCNAGGKRFVRNLGFERVKGTPQAVTGALQLYFSGESLRNVQRFLRLQGVKPHLLVGREYLKYYDTMFSGLNEELTISK